MERPLREEEGRARGGVLVVLEGVEGCGKSTQAARLRDRLAEAGVPHLLAREPGGTAGGERVRDVVLDPALELTAEAELLLLLAARAEFVRRKVRPALEEGRVVVADRYELSTFAYQGLARGLGLDRVRTLNRFATGGLRADLTIVLTVDPREGRRRREGQRPDRLESEDEAFHGAVADAYAELAASEAGTVSVDGTGSPDEVERRVNEVLQERLPGHFPPETFPRAEGL